MTVEVAQGPRAISNEIAARLKAGQRLPLEQVRRFAESLEGKQDAQAILKTLAEKTGIPPMQANCLVRLPGLLDEYDKRRAGDGLMRLKDLLVVEDAIQKWKVLDLVQPETRPGQKGKDVEVPLRVDRATKIYQEILCAVAGKTELAAHEISSLEKRLSNNERFVALQESRAPLYPPSREPGEEPSPTISLSDVRNIARVTRKPYISVRMAQALEHGGVLGDLAEEMINASRDAHTNEASKARCTSIESSFALIAIILPVAEKQLSPLNTTDFAEKILAIQQWDAVKQILTTIASSIKSIDEKAFPQQGFHPGGLANVVNNIYKALCLPDSVPALRRNKPYSPADFKDASANARSGALSEIEIRLKGFQNEVSSYLKLLEAGWTLVAVAVGDLGGEKLASGRGRAISRNEKTREIDIVAWSPRTADEPSMLNIIEVKSSADGVLHSAHGPLDAEVPTALRGDQIVALGNLANSVARYFGVPDDTPRRVLHLVNSPNDPWPSSKFRQDCLKVIPELFRAMFQSEKIEYGLKAIQQSGRSAVYDLVQ